MKIFDIEIRNFRGIEHFSLRNIPDTGVILISGENELGKSTVLEAVHTVLYEKHTSTKAAIKQCQPRGQDVGPFVELSFQLNEVRVRIAKRWLKEKKSELQIFAPHAQSYTGQEADAKLQELLALNLDNDLFNTLFVRQDEIAPAFDAAGIPSLRHALNTQQDMGAEDTAEDSQLMEAVKAEYKRFYTEKGGRETGVLKESKHTWEQARTMRQEAEQDKQHLDEYVRRFESNERILTQSEAELSQLRSDYQLLQERSAKLQKVQAGVEQLAQEIHSIEQSLELSQRQVEERQELRTLIEQLSTALTSLESQREECVLESEKEDTARLECAQTIERCSEQLRALKEQVTVREHYLGIGQLSQDLERKKQRLELWDELSAQVEHELTHPQHQVDAVLLEDIKQAATDLKVAQQVLQQEATQIQFTATSPSVVYKEGEELHLDEPLIEYLVDQTSYQIGEVEMQINPGASQEQRQRDMAEKQDVLSALLVQARAASLQEAQDQHERWKLQQDTLTQLRKRLKELEEEQLISELRSEVELATQQLEEAVASGYKAASLQQYREELASAKQELEELDQTRAQEMLNLNRFSERPARQKLTQVESECEFRKEELERTSTRLEEKEAAQSTSDLHTAVEEQTHSLETKQEQLALLEQQLVEDDAAEVLERFAHTQQLLEEKKSKIAKLQLSQAELKKDMEYAAGVAERYELAQAEEARAASTFRRVRKQAAAARTLFETLSAHRDAARRKYAQPFVEELRRLSSPVFGRDISFELDENLKLRSRVLKQTNIEVQQLSAGAQEQIGLLLRFAVAALVARQADNQGVPIFIDDALGSTDWQRLESMALVISELARHHQLFIFSCVPERFNRVVGKQEFTMQELLSADA